MLETTSTGFNCITGGVCKTKIKSFRKLQNLNRVVWFKMRYFKLSLSMALLLQLHPDNPNPRNLKTIVDCLSGGGVIVYPTDTIYGFGCDIFQPKAVEKICR